MLHKKRERPRTGAGIERHFEPAVDVHEAKTSVALPFAGHGADPYWAQGREKPSATGLGQARQGSAGDVARSVSIDPKADGARGTPNRRAQSLVGDGSRFPFADRVIAEDVLKHRLSWSRRPGQPPCPTIATVSYGSRTSFFMSKDLSRTDARVCGETPEPTCHSACPNPR